MFNDLERLCGNAALQQLLSHYAEAGVAVHGAWHERVALLEGVDSRRLPRLHGELLACEWIEQNTHQTLHSHETAARCCYRITEAGMLAHKQVLTGLLEAGDVLSSIAARTEARRTLRNDKARAHRKTNPM